MTIKDMQRIFREEMRLAGFKKIGSNTWALEFDEISWVYSLSKDRYGDRFSLMLGINIKGIGDGGPPKNYIDCPIVGGVLDFMPSIGFDQENLVDLFNAIFEFAADEREAQQRRFYKIATRFSSERATLSSIQDMLKDHQLPNIGIRRIAQPLIPGSRTPDITI